MLHFLAAHWIAICVVGIVLNFIVVFKAAEEQPEGPMGMEIVFLFCFIPYVVAILAGASKLFPGK